MCDQLVQEPSARPSWSTTRAGAGGNIGTVELARATPRWLHARPDLGGQPHAEPVLYSKLPYNPDKDIVAISRWRPLPTCWASRRRLASQQRRGADRALQEGARQVFVRLVRPWHVAAPERRTLQEVWPASISSMCPTRARAAVYSDLMAGVVNMMFANMPSMLPQVRAGKLKGLGVTSAQRSKAAPDIPAIAETRAGLCRHLVVRHRCARGHARSRSWPRIETAIAGALQSPEIQKRWNDDLGLDLPPARPRRLRSVPGRGPQALGSPPVKASGVKLD